MDIFDFEECPFLISWRDFVFYETREILHIFGFSHFQWIFYLAKQMWFGDGINANKMRFFENQNFGGILRIRQRKCPLDIFKGC